MVADEARDQKIQTYNYNRRMFSNDGFIRLPPKNKKKDSRRAPLKGLNTILGFKVNMNNSGLGQYKKVIMFVIDTQMTLKIRLCDCPIHSLISKLPMSSLQET